MTREVSNGLLVPPWEEGKRPGKLSGGQKSNAHGRALDAKRKKKRRAEWSGHKQKVELCEKWTLFRSLESHPFTKPGRETVLSLGDSQAWPSFIIAKLFVVFICQDVLIELQLVWLPLRRTGAIVICSARPCLECANCLTKWWLTSLPGAGGSFAFRHVVVVVVLFRSVPIQSSCLGWTGMKFPGPKGRFQLGGQRGLQKSLHPLFDFPLCLRERHPS